MSMTTDIFYELNIQELQELKTKYSKIKHAFYVSILIDTAIKWWEKAGEKMITVTSPKNSWKEDGSIVVFLNEENIFPYSLDETYDNVREGLLKTQKINPIKTLIFANVHRKNVDVIHEVIKEMNRKIVANFENDMYIIDIEKAKYFEIICPPGTYLNKLKETNANQINGVWPHKHNNSEKHVALWINFNGGYGLFSKTDDQLLSWVLQGPLGHINLLQTEEKHKGKGYGKVMVKVIAKDIAEAGHIPLATVITKNIISAKLFDSLGFEIIGRSNFMITESYSSL